MLVDTIWAHSVLFFHPMLVRIVRMLARSAGALACRARTRMRAMLFVPWHTFATRSRGLRVTQGYERGPAALLRSGSSAFCESSFPMACSLDDPDR